MLTAFAPTYSVSPRPNSALRRRNKFQSYRAASVYWRNLRGFIGYASAIDYNTVWRHSARYEPLTRSH